MKVKTFDVNVGQVVGIQQWLSRQCAYLDSE
jgi:hypothetical protein